MADYNKVVLLGRLSRDPQLRFTATQMAVCNMGVAVGRKWKSATGEAKEETAFIDVTAWGKTAENVQKYLKKGSLVLVDGHLTTESWTDKATDQKRSKTVVTADGVQFLDGKPKGEAYKPAGAGHPTERANETVNDGAEDDTIPFDG